MLTVSHQTLHINISTLLSTSELPAELTVDPWSGLCPDKKTSWTTHDLNVQSQTKTHNTSNETQIPHAWNYECIHYLCINTITKSINAQINSLNVTCICRINIMHYYLHTVLLLILLLLFYRKALLAATLACNRYCKLLTHHS